MKVNPRGDSVSFSVCFLQLQMLQVHRRCSSKCNLQLHHRRHPRTNELWWIHARPRLHRVAPFLPWALIDLMSKLLQPYLLNPDYTDMILSLMSRLRFTFSLPLPFSKQNNDFNLLLRFHWLSLSMCQSALFRSALRHHFLKPIVYENGNGIKAPPGQITLNVRKTENAK